MNTLDTFISTPAQAPVVHLKAPDCLPHVELANEAQARYAEDLRKCTGAISVTCTEERRLVDGTLIQISQGTSSI